MSEAITIYMPKILTQEIDLLVGTTQRYISRAEFIRDAIRLLLWVETGKVKVQ